MIDSLQEQVNNAKDKLLRLMSTSQSHEDPDMDSSATNLNSSYTQTTEIQSDCSLPQIDPKSQLSPPHLATAVTTSSEYLTATDSPHHSALPDKMYVAEEQNSVSAPLDKDTSVSKAEQPMSLPSSGLLRTTEETVNFVTSLQCHKGLNPFQVEALGSHRSLTSHLGPNARLTGFVSNEQLQEILQELSVDAVIETTLRSPGQAARTPSVLKTSTISPLSLRKPHSPQPPALHNSISPYAMRKRRPPFHSSRRGLTPPCFYTGCGKIWEDCEQQKPCEHSDRVAVDGTLLQDHSSGLEIQANKEQETEGHRVIRKCQRCVSRSYKYSAEDNHSDSPDVKAGGDDKQHHRHIRDSCGYWDSDSSSSTDYCYYHRPYCDSCLQRGSLSSSASSSSDSSDSEYEDFTGLYRSPHPVVFKEDLKPTFV